jgi:hypothetical protein
METEIQEFQGAKNGTHLIECIKKDQSFNYEKAQITFIGKSHGMPAILSKVVDGIPYLFNKKTQTWNRWFEERQ